MCSQYQPNSRVCETHWWRPMKSSFSLGTIMGIPFGVNFSWFIIFFALAAILALSYFPYWYPDWSQALYWLLGFVTSLLFFASVVAHEVAHCVVAVRRGIEVKSITLFVLGGVSRITREASEPSTELIMAVAGPLSSVALGGIGAVIWLASRNAVEPLGAVAFYLFWINMALAVFNLLPSFPMDGGRVLRSLVWWRNGDYMRATRIACRIGQVTGGLVILVGVAVAIMVNAVSGLWAVMIGLFVTVASTTSYRQEMLRSSLRGFNARDVMTLDCQRVPAQLPVEVAATDYFRSGDVVFLVVEERGEPAGIVVPKHVKKVSKQRRRTTSVAEIMTPIEEVGVVSPEDDGMVTLERIEEGNLGVVVAMDGDGLAGFVERDHLLDRGFDHPEQGG